MPSWRIAPRKSAWTAPRWPIFLAGDTAAKEMLAADRAAREASVSGVPSFFLDGYSLYSGAMPAETMAEALRKGNQILRQRAA
jgi:predicted DsbA family dithiol-disulfide isomerase